MANQNQVNITGRLGQDAEFKSFNNGGGVCNFSVAVSETWLDKNSGERQEKTEWIPVAMFSKGAEKLAQYLTKGTQVRVTGKFKTRGWESEGVKHQRTEVVVDSFGTEVELLGSPNKNNQQQGNYNQPAQGYQNNQSQNNQSQNQQQGFNNQMSNQGQPPQQNQQGGNQQKHPHPNTQNSQAQSKQTAMPDGPVDNEIPF